MRNVFMGLGLLGLLGCASAPQGPEWIHQPTRTVDNGYIVYVGSGTTHNNSEKAQFQAEGVALEDLANECSFIPKGTRIEDRFTLKGDHEDTAYVKVAVEFQECTQAQKSLEPEDIRKFANASFTEQLRRYQDLEETGEMADKSEYAALEAPTEVQAPPRVDPAWNSSVHFAVMRQYVAYQKETVILAGPTVYAPNSVQSTRFVSAIQPASGQIEQLAQQTPALAKSPQPWSKIYDRPRVARPGSLAPPHRTSRYKSAAPALKDNKDRHAGEKKSGHGKGRGKRRRPPNS